MKNTFSGKQTGIAAICAVVLGLSSVAASAQSTTPSNTQGYLTDNRNAVVKSGFGLCWQAGTGPTVSTPECDPNYKAPVAAVTPPPAPAPAPQVAAAPPPAPVVVPAPAPASERVTLDADALFDFDKADLRPAGRASLDAFVTQMQGIDPEMVIAVGHADRLGSDEYNQKLSERRVATVKSYLVSKGIPADRILAEGKGETQPVTTADQCPGNKSARVIACLQPDRRVDLEVVGTRRAN